MCDRQEKISGASNEAAHSVGHLSRALVFSCKECWVDPDIADVVLHSVVMFGSSSVDIRVMVFEDGCMNSRCIRGHSLLSISIRMYIQHLYLHTHITYIYTVYNQYILICMHSCIHC